MKEKANKYALFTHSNALLSKPRILYFSFSQASSPNDGAFSTFQILLEKRNVLFYSLNDSLQLFKAGNQL
jgi:hypothetical protein